MTREISSDDKVFRMFKQYMKVISEDSFTTGASYKEPEVLALGLTLAHQIDHVVCQLKPEGYQEPPTVRKVTKI